MDEQVTVVDSWVRVAGLAAIAAALPTVVWRVVVGLGANLGTPASWRRSEAIPGSGTTYVIGLSVVQLAAALLTVVLFVPRADRIPRAGRRWPAGLVVGTSLAGAVVLAVLCVLSAVRWSHVDPFRDAATTTGWTYLCWACYAVACAWPPLLVAATLGYRGARRAARVGG